jgi:HCOMODA/2-hydroxy-3-carboxy-muconic semialdehyde decarboxylase
MMVVALVLGGVSLLTAQLPGAAPAQGSSPAPSLASLKQDLVIADRILFSEGFLDTAGHVSVRLAADRFLMAWRRAPELIVAEDLMEYDLSGNVGDAKGRPLILERFIHAEIYRARPDVRAIVHGHTPSLVMFSSSNIPLRPLFSGAAFIGESVPAFKNGDAGGGVQTAELGRRLAETMGKGGAVLMRGHGVVVGCAFARGSGSARDSPGYERTARVTPSGDGRQGTDIHPSQFRRRHSRYSERRWWR